MTPLPAYCRSAAFEAFRRELSAADSPEGLLRAAATISLHAEPEADIDQACEVVAQLTAAVRRRLQSDSEEAALAHLHDVLFDLVGFRGVEQSDYYDPANSHLPRVLATRRGIPISLALVYRSVAAPLGLRVDGINAPGHFLVGVTCREATGERVQYVDPFYGGALLSRHEALAQIEQVTGQPPSAEIDPLAVATPAVWLRRMLLNLQGIFARHQQERDVLAMQELQSLLPQD